MRLKVLKKKKRNVLYRLRTSLLLFSRPTYNLYIYIALFFLAVPWLRKWDKKNLLHVVRIKLVHTHQSVNRGVAADLYKYTIYNTYTLRNIQYIHAYKITNIQYTTYIDGHRHMKVYHAYTHRWAPVQENVQYIYT